MTTTRPPRAWVAPLLTFLAGAAITGLVLTGHRGFAAALALLGAAAVLAALTA